MRTPNLTLLALWLCACPAQAALVAYWPFNEGSGTSTADRSGNGHTGTLCEGSTCPSAGATWVAGKVHRAIQCNSTGSNNVNVAHNTALNITGDMTIAFWFQLLSLRNLGTGGFAILGTKEDASATIPWGVQFASDDGVTAYFAFYHTPNTGKLFDSWMNFLGYTVPLTTWVHVAFVRNVSTEDGTLYVNGVLSATVDYGVDDPGTPTAALRFCLTGDLLDHQAHVAIDEVRLYNHRLSADSIRRLATRGRMAR